MPPTSLLHEETRHGTAPRLSTETPFALHSKDKMRITMRLSLMDLGKYTYTPLRDPGDDGFDIRVVRLFAGAEDDDIRIAISTCRIKEPPSESHGFIALSYTWGSAANPQNVTVEVHDEKLSSSAARDVSEMDDSNTREPPVIIMAEDA
jgi:hypothetical protein